MKLISKKPLDTPITHDLITAIKWDGTDDCFIEILKELGIDAFVEDDELIIKRASDLLLVRVNSWVVKGFDGFIYAAHDDVIVNHYEPRP